MLRYTKTDTWRTASHDELEKYMALDVQLNENDDILSFLLKHKLKFAVQLSVVLEMKWRVIGKASLSNSDVDQKQLVSAAHSKKFNKIVEEGCIVLFAIVTKKMMK